MSRLPVQKTYKLYIGGAFPRSESGRTYEAEGANVARGSRKDLRDAVRAARAAFPKWSTMTAYNRGQVVYRIAEMLESRRARVRRAQLRRRRGRPLDRPPRLVRRAGRTSSRRCSAPRTRSPARTSTSRSPSRPASSGILAPDEPPLAGLVSRVAPAIVGGNTTVVVASETHPLAAVELAEVLATSDVPGGVVNLLTGFREELAPWLAGHMDVNALDLAGADGQVEELERLAAENVKRVVRGAADDQSPWEIASFLELKTVWHPIGV